MPRGGGGFRGGGLGGGGFRGGGFRGGSRSFRVGSVRSSGRPFGRTGSRRTVSRAPRGRSYHRPHHRRHWGGYYRPWYRRWWHWHWWWGYPYRPWYYAPVYWGGGAILAIIALLVILPLIGVAFWYPFSNTSPSGVVTYSDTQTLFYNEYWYEKEYLSQGQSIDYRVEAQSEVTFLIWNQPFENFPLSDSPLTGSYSENDMTVLGNHDYQYVGYFLKPGSRLDYQFNVTLGGPIEFFVTDANDLYRWNNWETIIFKDSYIGSAGYSGGIDINYAQDYYLVWYNSGTNPVSIDFTVDYSAAGAFDFSDAEDNGVLERDVVDPVSGSLSVPSSGDWYFFVYFDPFVNPAESVDITFDVSYNTEVTYDQQWKKVTPIFLLIGFIIVILLIVAIIQRRTSKETPSPTDTTTTTTPVSTTPPTTTETVQVETSKTCHRCNSLSKLGDVYCVNCGAKLSGRDYGVSTITTPASAKNCRSCGKALIPESRYCKYCGAKIEQEAKPYKYFPDEREAFFCQLDNEKHPSTDSAYECEQCSRKICGDCYNTITQTGVTRCPYCKGELRQIQ
ncbi:MAG: zinc ribbon domain-containing protein [Candidatus Heimdallarchaeota archaeon]|nr:MAG: zinc ribbon domain-containing protein [Candidatus Heimdallarchaeota archaeon]